MNHLRWENKSVWNDVISLHFRIGSVSNVLRKWMNAQNKIRRNDGGRKIAAHDWISIWF